MPGTATAKGGKRTRARTGCRTCKIRRIKCDESRPACRKCTSTGRKCDGYGIWGGRGTEPDLPHQRMPLIQTPSSTINCSLSQEDKAYFSWFCHRTVKKIPGLFRSTFWDGLVLQVCYDEPAVLHAAISIGSAHRLGGLEAVLKGGTNELPHTPEMVILKHYNIAIRQLQPYFLDKKKTSVRVVLIICMIFTAMEFLLGHYRTGERHLENGMKLIGDLVASEDSTINLDANRDDIDTKLLEAFANMNLNCLLLGRGVTGLYKLKQGFDAYPLPAMFESMAQARKRLDWLLNDTLQITQQWQRANAVDFPATQLPRRLLDHKRRIETQLSSWFRIFKVSRVSLVAQMGFSGPIAYRVLNIYYAMTYIMASACLHPSGEMAFDDHTDKFTTIINQSLTLRREIFTTDFKDTHLEHIDDAIPFIADRGWIVPLYFVATKCRVSHLRLQAIKLLRLTVTREAIWDARTASTIAGEIWIIEDPDSYEVLSANTKFDPTKLVAETDLGPPAVPRANRISRIEVLLPNEAGEKTTIICHRSGETLTRECDSATKTWVYANQGNIFHSAENTHNGFH